MSRSTLEAAFRATTYRVETPGAVFDLRIGETNPGFAAFLRQQGVSSWGVVTACNPGGNLSPDRNRVRNEELLERIKALGWRFYPAGNHADARDWPIEPAFCVLDANVATLISVAADFGQVAVVYGETEKRDVMLLWI